MKSLLFLVLGMASFAATAEQCYRFNEGLKDVRIGRGTFVADSFCVQGDYTPRSAEELKFTLKLGATPVASYDASSDRYSNTDVRFTIWDGYPEPTQFNAKISRRFEQLTDIDFAGFIVPIGIGGKYTCTENSPKVGASDLYLVQIGNTTEWDLSLYDNVYGRSPELVQRSVVRVELDEDVELLFSNPKDGVTFKMYRDESYSNYLTLPGTDRDLVYDCK